MTQAIQGGPLQSLSKNEPTRPKYLAKRAALLGTAFVLVLLSGGGVTVLLFMLLGYLLIRVQNLPLKKAQEVAVNNQRQLQAILDSWLQASPVGMAFVDRNLRFIRVNEAWARMNGRTVSEHIGQRVSDVIPAAAPEVDSLIRQVLDTGKPLQGVEKQLSLAIPNGVMRDFLLNYHPVLTGEGELLGVGITVADISEHKEAVRAREEVLAVVSHDLRQPLGVVLMNAALISRRAPSIGFGAWASSQAGKIRSAGERMNALIEDLLSLSKIQAGHFSLVRSNQCGIDIVEEALEATKSLAEEKTIHTLLDPVSESFKLCCDHGQLSRVFANLLGNAIKFTPEDGLVRVHVEVRESEVQFSVTDTGPGIAEHHIAHVFDRFWQAKATAHQGTGLGLAIVKGIVEAHGGRIWLESEFGNGATFHFTIPRSDQGAQTATEKKSA